MKVVLNGHEVTDAFGADETLGRALLVVQDQHIDQARVISTITLDGEPLTAQNLSEWKDRPVQDFREAQIDAPQKDELASHSLRILAQGLEESHQDREDLVKLVHQGRSEQAIQQLTGYLRIWESLQQSLGSVERLLDIDLNETEVFSVKPPQDADWETTRVVDLIRLLSSRLDDMKQALEATDLVLLGDILDYDFADLTRDWNAVLVELADRLGTPAN